MKSACIPDLSSRPHQCTVERTIKASPKEIYEAWTSKFDMWFAQPGETMMHPEIDRPFFFYNRHDWGRHAHYGRFLELVPDKLVVMTWVTGKDATFGAETVVRVELTPVKEGTLVRLTHSGFDDAQACKGHEEQWPSGLETLEDCLRRVSA